MKPIVLLDGGMGQELLKRSRSKPSPLWSAQVLMDEPEIVKAVHRDYIDAGARVLTLNSYSATPERLERDGDPAMFEPLQRRAIELAQAARDEAGADVALAGCLPPLKASYRPDLVTDRDWAMGVYSRIVEIQAPHVDAMLCETLASVLEIGAAVEAAKAGGKPVWLAMTLRDGAQGLLRSGEPVSAGIAEALRCGAGAILLNCSWPETISAAFGEIAASGKPFGAYANGFTAIDKLMPGGTVEQLTAREDLGPAAYAEFALHWAERGASIVGGCCEVGPAHIAHLASRLREEGYEIGKNFDA